MSPPGHAPRRIRVVEDDAFLPLNSTEIYFWEWLTWRYPPPSTYLSSSYTCTHIGITFVIQGLDVPSILPHFCDVESCCNQMSCSGVLTPVPAIVVGVMQHLMMMQQSQVPRQPPCNTLSTVSNAQATQRLSSETSPSFYHRTRLATTLASTVQPLLTLIRG
uniref:Uncharacterized protein n=1 Tax=Hyaloperonospora arabidopsidis (strain Emoy2) TaxID=559515 RepID=M4B1G5_HYAAE